MILGEVEMDEEGFFGNFVGSVDSMAVLLLLFFLRLRRF